MEGQQIKLQLYLLANLGKLNAILTSDLTMDEQVLKRLGAF
jgi:hypothetical protein